MFPGDQQEGRDYTLAHDLTLATENDVVIVARVALLHDGLASTHRQFLQPENERLNLRRRQLPE